MPKIVVSANINSKTLEKISKLDDIMKTKYQNKISKSMLMDCILNLGADVFLEKLNAAKSVEEKNEISSMLLKHIL